MEKFRRIKAPDIKTISMAASLLLALVIVFSTCLAAFAGDGSSPDSTDSRIIENPGTDNNYTFRVDESGYTASPQSVKYEWFSYDKDDILSSGFASNFVYRKTYEESEGKLVKSADGKTVLSLSPAELAPAGSDAEDCTVIAGLYLPEGAYVSVKAKVTGTENACMYIIEEDCSFGGEFGTDGTYSIGFAADKAGICSLAVSADVNSAAGETAAFELTELIVYIPQTAETLDDNSTPVLNLAGLSGGIYVCRASFISGAETDFVLTSEPVSIDSAEFMASIFSGSTGLLIIGSVVIIGAAIAIIVINKNKVKL